MRRIQRDICHEGLLKILTTGDFPLFKEIWRAMLFAAALGIYEGKRRPLAKSDSGKAIPENYFSSPGWRGFLYLIGVADSGDSQCLHSTDDVQDALVTAFEEYSNQGFHTLSERIRGEAYLLDDVTSLLLESCSPKPAAPDLADLI
jgi:dnd system-associated protein 4